MDTKTPTPKRLTTTRELPVKLTQDEIDERGRALAKSVAEVARLQRAAKLEASSWKELIKTEEERITKLTRATNSGVEDREVECAIQITGNVAEIVRLDTLEVVDVRAATKQELRDRYVQTTIYDHGADMERGASDAGEESKETGGEEPAEAPAPLAIEAKVVEVEVVDEDYVEDESVPVEHEAIVIPEVALRVSERLLGAAMGPTLTESGTDGTLLRHAGFQYIVTGNNRKAGTATALRVKAKDTYKGVTSEYNPFADSVVGQVVQDVEQVQYVIVSDTIYQVCSLIEVEPSTAVKVA